MNFRRRRVWTATQSDLLCFARGACTWWLSEFLKDCIYLWHTMWPELICGRANCCCSTTMRRLLLLNYHVLLQQQKDPAHTRNRQAIPNQTRPHRQTSQTKPDQAKLCRLGSLVLGPCGCGCSEPLAWVPVASLSLWAGLPLAWVPLDEAPVASVFVGLVSLARVPVVAAALGPCCFGTKAQETPEPLPGPNRQAAHIGPGRQGHRHTSIYSHTPMHACVLFTAPLKGSCQHPPLTFREDRLHASR